MGQGSWGGPSACSTNTSFLIDGLALLAKGLLFTVPSQLLIYKNAAKMFINDLTNLLHLEPCAFWAVLPRGITLIVPITLQGSNRISFLHPEAVPRSSAGLMECGGRGLHLVVAMFEFGAEETGCKRDKKR